MERTFIRLAVEQYLIIVNGVEVPKKAILYTCILHNGLKKEN